MPKKNTHVVKVSIAGRDFRLSTDEDDGYVQALADSVSSRILELKRAAGASTLDSSLLTAFCLADEKKKLQARLDEAGKQAAASKPRTEKNPPRGGKSV